MSRLLRLSFLLVAGCAFDQSGHNSATPTFDDAGHDASPARDGMPLDAVDAAVLPDAAPPFQLRVQAEIDGLSRLILSGDTVRWFHVNFAAPGRVDGGNEPTLIDGAVWFPGWPDVPTAENRDCGCDSSSRGLAGSLPRVPSTVTLTTVQARGAVTVTQLPDANNDYTVVITFDDSGPFGGATYIIELEVIENQ